MFTNFKLKKKNKKNFHFKSNNNKIILIEYNSFHGSHLCQALLANFLKKKNFSKIVAYFNYCLIVSPLRLNLLQKIKWKLSSLLNFGFKGIYKSFGVEKFIRPEITKDTKDISNKIVDNFFSQKVNKFDVINFKIESLQINQPVNSKYFLAIKAKKLI